MAIFSQKGPNRKNRAKANNVIQFFSPDPAHIGQRVTNAAIHRRSNATLCLKLVFKMDFDVLNDRGDAEFWPCLDKNKKAISSQFARKRAISQIISVQAAIGLLPRYDVAYVHDIIISKYQLK